MDVVKRRAPLLLAALALAPFAACQPGPPPPVAATPAEVEPAPKAESGEAGGSGALARGSVPRPPSPLLGTNLDAFQDYSLEWPLIDAFKRSRGWISGTSGGAWDDGRPLELDSNGWVKRLEPGQVARALLFWTEHSDHPLGDYLVTFEGEGKLDFWGTGKVVASGPGRYLLRVEHARNGIAVFLTRTEPSNPVRNVRVILPGGACTTERARPCHIDAECGRGACVPLEAAGSALYHPAFLRSLAPYGVIRFMNWMLTNGSKEHTWEDRPKMTDAQWTVHGVPVEAMVELTNVLGADPWFTLPHGADDGYFRHFAEYVRDHSKSRKVYIELSNEVWNYAFPQSSEIEAQARKEGLSNDRFEGLLRWYARRSVGMFRIFQEVFAGTERLVRVLGSQSSNPSVSETVLSFEQASEHADALAIAPYFGGELGTPEWPGKVSGMTLDQLMAELEGPAVDRAADTIRKQADVAKRFELSLVAYEGGQHLIGLGPLGDDTRLNRLFDVANRDPRMKSVYLRYLHAWRHDGGGAFVHYTSFGDFSRWGRWGAVERVGQPRAQAPKLDALMTFAEELAAGPP